MGSCAPCDLEAPAAAHRRHPAEGAGSEHPQSTCGVAQPVPPGSRLYLRQCDHACPYLQMSLSLLNVHHGVPNKEHCSQVSAGTSLAGIVGKQEEGSTGRPPSHTGACPGQGLSVSLSRPPRPPLPAQSKPSVLTRQRTRYQDPSAEEMAEVPLGKASI